MMFHKQFVLLALIAIFSSSNLITALEIRGGVGQPQRNLFLCWLFGCETNEDTGGDTPVEEETSAGDTPADAPADDEEESSSLGSWLVDTVEQVWCGLFRNCEDAEDPDRPDPIGEIAEDIANTTDGSNPVEEALNKTVGSDTPLRDFFGELLGVSGSSTPVQDFLEQAYGRSDTPLLDFIADLFNTITGPSAETFVDNIVNGTNPVDYIVDEWLSGPVFKNLNCPAAGPACAVNIEGEPGVWVCRSLKNPFFPDNDASSNTVCAHPDFTLANNDVCGSCDGTYPTTCPCPCELEEGGAGVKVILSSGSSQCVDKAWATSAQVYYESLSCVTVCA